MNCNSVLQGPYNIEIRKKHYFYKREKSHLMKDDSLKYEQAKCDSDYAYTELSYFNKHDYRKSEYAKYKDGFIVSKEAKQVRILIAESEQELLLLFKTYLESRG